MENTMAVMSLRNFGSFEDILAARRGTSDFQWMTRAWHPLAAYDQVCKTNPAQMKRYVLDSPRLQLVIEELSKEQNVPKELLYKNVSAILDEVGQKREMAVIRWLGLFFVTMVKRSCAGVFVNDKQVSKIKSLMGNNPVIFAPSHRSYIDFMLMSYICYHYDIQIPAIAAGMDFHSMWLVGQLMREACAFFMRRSFNSDRLYAATFKEYVSKLVTHGESALEFYIEGTRSRSAKSLMPKFGFLSMALSPFFAGYVPDVTIVPWTISYDRTPEEALFAYELLGVPKPKESTSGLIKALKMLDERYGNIYVDIGEPVSAKEFFGARLDRSVHALEPAGRTQHTPHEAALVTQLAHEVVHRQQQLAVVTTFNLVAVLLGDSLALGGPPLTVPRLVKEISWLKSVIETLGALVNLPGQAGGVERAVNDALLVHKSLVNVGPSGELRLARIHTSNKQLDPARLRGHNLSCQTMEVATPLMMLQHYVNPCMHYFIGPAIITVIMQHLDSSRQIDRDDLFNQYHFVRSVLSHEFVLYSARENQEFEESLAQLDLLDIVEVAEGGRLGLGNHRKLQMLLCNLLRPFLDGYLAVSQVLQQAPGTERQLLPRVQRLVESQLGIAMHPASLSLDMYSAAIQSFTSLQAVSKRNVDGQVVYEKTGNLLEEISHRLGNLVTLPQEKRRIDPFDVKNWLVVEERAKL